MSRSITALNSYLEPLQRYFNQDGVNEVIINKPLEIWVEKKGEVVKHDVKALTLEHLKSLAILIAQSTDQMVSETNPLLSATLPNGYRVQVIMPPACEPGTIGFAIRKPSSMSLTMDDYEKMGAFKDASFGVKENEDSAELMKILQTGDIKEFLKQSVTRKQNIIVSGGTSTGKTTFTNALLRSIPEYERLITIEDAREVVLDMHENKMHLLSSKGGQGKANVGPQELIETCLRLRPERIIMGELRGQEAFGFLRAINTGHPGSISTVHADTPKMALQQLKLMVMQAGLGMPPSEVFTYIKQVIDVVVQLKRGSKGVRYVSEIYFKYKEELLGSNEE
ncbi:MAG: P-type DNA transfer ATPase VirB11 [Alphaproteobacteria bacterium]|nr:P-type DNA transfer ATPase VirB11 [Rickettsiales bacterium]